MKTMHFSYVLKRGECVRGNEGVEVSFLNCVHCPSCTECTHDTITCSWENTVAPDIKLKRIVTEAPVDHNTKITLADLLLKNACIASSICSAPIPCRLICILGIM